MKNHIKIKECGIPELSVSLPKLKPKKRITPFDLSSHKRAREAIDLGMKMRAPDFNIFIIGKSRTRRILGTSQYVQTYLDRLPPPPDWVYLHNFQQKNKPCHYRFPAGMGKEFQLKLISSIHKIRNALLTLFLGESFSKAISKEEKIINEFIDKNLLEIRKIGKAAHLDLQQAEDGTILIISKKNGQNRLVEELSLEEAKELSPILSRLQESLSILNEAAILEEEKLMDRLEDMKKERAFSCINPFIKRLDRSFGKVPGIREWLQELQEDILENLGILTNVNPEYKEVTESFMRRYSANLLVSNDPSKGPRVIVESNPTYENLFGSIKYYTTPMGGFETDFTMIEEGALHRSNGGVLILRAEDLVTHEHSWRFLKAALRDREIRIEEMHRISGIPLLAAPAPTPIPLDIQIILVGSSHWYCSFFYNDEDFQNYFKIKADMDDTIPLSAQNIDVIGLYLHESCVRKLEMKCDQEALSYVMGYGCRLASHRKKISVQIDILMDIMKEASVFARQKKLKTIKKSHVIQAIESRHYRNSHFQDLEQQSLEEDLILIQTKGTAIGQVNGLTVQTIGAETFGSPIKITAQTYMGRTGVINIEHMVELSGPIQHKGVLSLEGFLRGLFGQQFPISFSGTITFEQNYAGVEGDSASLAELMALLSSLAEIPFRQDIAITGSMNQMGNVQPIGGVNEKIEGFYYTCKRQGLTGEQGVIIPKSNILDLVLLEEISDAVKEDKFHIWAISEVFEAVEILSNMESGLSEFDSPNGKNTVFGKVWQKLLAFDQKMQNRYVDSYIVR
ncbi:MAG: Lon protease family protein [Alphaproteobacteria bacterium]